MAIVLTVDDDKTVREYLKIVLSKFNLEVITAASGEEALEIFKDKLPNIVLTDIKMPGLSGLDLLTSIRNINRTTPVIVLTGYDDMHMQVKAMELGAYDYIEKPIVLDHLQTVITKAIESCALSNELVESLNGKELEEFDDAYRLTGKSQAMKEIYKKIGQVCSSKVTVLVQGESGTGKELIAKTIHYSGITKDQPFIAVNCSALTETLLESELFGHVKGSFTGAIKDKKGKFELAGEGTIFLDEISEISNALQVKLLRVLQEKEFEQVGGEETKKIKARILAATNKNLRLMVEKGKFRKDLYYRLNVFTINIPPLRKRKEDIPLLVVELLKKINLELHKSIRKIPFDVMDLLQNHHWHGNVRELQNILLQAAVLTKGDVLEKENILFKAAQDKPSSSNKLIKKIEAMEMSLEELERLYIFKVLQKCKGNKQKACRVLGITKPTLLSKLKKYLALQEDSAE